MHKIDAPGATVDFLFTEGNPTLGIPATEVSDDWLNDVQEELVTVIENAGIVLVKGQQDQLFDAIAIQIGLGGDKQLSQAILNNSGPNDVTGLIVAKANFKAAHIAFDVHRQTDTSNEQEIGWLYLTHDPKDDVWRITKNSFLDDAGMTFTVIVATGQVQYTSDNLVGANYAGTLRISQVLKAKQ